MPLRTEDLIETENAGRRCGVCHSGRGSRRFEVVCPAGREPVVLCGNCRARFGDDPPVGRQPAHLLEPVPATAEPPAPPEQRRARPAHGSPTSGAARAAWLVLHGDGRPCGRHEQRQGACSATRTWSAAATFDALASAGRPSRHRASSPQPWIGSKRGRATFGSSGNAHGSADQPPARHRRLIAADQLWSRPVGNALRTLGTANVVAATSATVVQGCSRPAVVLAEVSACGRLRSSFCPAAAV